MRRDVRTHALWLATAAALINLTAVETPGAQAPAPAQAPLTGVDLVRSTYTEFEYMVPTRDGRVSSPPSMPPRTPRNGIRS